MLYLELTLICASLAIGIFALWQSANTSKRLSSILGGTDSESLESSLTKHANKVAEVNRKLVELLDQYKKLTVISSLASQKISIVRFNPFGDTGGDQSFSLAVLDAYNSGYVTTSIHGRQGTRVYIKPIDFGKSKYTLSDEEKQAISQAVKRTPKFNKN
jgi:hypothetical protein